MLQIHFTIALCYKFKILDTCKEILKIKIVYLFLLYMVCFFGLINLYNLNYTFQVWLS